MTFDQFGEKIITTLQVIVIIIAVLLIPITLPIAVALESIKFFRELMINKL